MIPRSFTHIEGWREDFEAAAKTLREVRTVSLFDHADEILGVRVRPLTLKTWTILDLTGNSLVTGMHPKTEDCLRALWVLRADWLGVKDTSSLARAIRAWRSASVLRRANYDEDKIKKLVADHVDSGFLDMPGRFSTGPMEPSNPVHYPRLSLEVHLASEVMAQFPALSFEMLREMPLAQFWQWLHRARKVEDPEYRNDQLTDQVNRVYCRRLNAMRKADREFQKS